MIIRQLLFYITALLCVCLIGCQNHQKLASSSYHHSLNKNIHHKKVVLAELHQLGLRYSISKGHLVVLLPVNKFFQKDTIHLKAGYPKKVTRFAQVLREYSVSHPVHSIRLVGYPDEQGANVGLLLPHQYAVVVAGYLWNQGLSMRMSGTIASSRDRQWVKVMLPRVKSSRGVILELSC